MASLIIITCITQCHGESPLYEITALKMRRALTEYGLVRGRDDRVWTSAVQNTRMGNN